MSDNNVPESNSNWTVIPGPADVKTILQDAVNVPQDQHSDNPPAIRDTNGRFIPGHKPIDCNHPLGTISGAGRPKAVKTQIKDALQIAVDSMPAILESMAARAVGEEECPTAVRQQAAEYLIDRIYGKANQPLSGIGNNNILIQVLQQLRGVPIKEEDKAISEANPDTEHINEDSPIP